MEGADRNEIKLAAAGGGRDRDRTGNLIIANDALSQLSYAPIIRRSRDEIKPQREADVNPFTSARCHAIFLGHED
jgi:hypothetical protein